MKLNFFQKMIASAGIIAFVILLAGCPYSSNVPIDEGTVKVPAGLEGEWISPGDVENENPTYYVIFKDDKFHATAKKMEYSTSDSAYNSTTYKLTFSDVGGDVYMNAQEDGQASYYLYKFGFDETKKEITCNEVSDYIKETFSTSDELKQFVMKNKANSYFFTNTTDNYVRK